jgi:hypothetical protein
MAQRAKKTLIPIRRASEFSRPPANHFPQFFFQPLVLRAWPRHSPSSPSGRETCSLAAEGPHFTLPIRSPGAAACTPVIPESALDDIFLPDIGLRHVLSGSAITLFHVFRFAWVVLRSFCGVRFALRPNGVACPAPARTFTTELAWMGSPLSSTSVLPFKCYLCLEPIVLPMS